MPAPCKICNKNPRARMSEGCCLVGCNCLTFVERDFSHALNEWQDWQDQEIKEKIDWSKVFNKKERFKMSKYDYLVATLILFIIFLLALIGYMVNS